MPLKPITRPNIEVPLTEEGDVVLRVTSIPEGAACAFTDRYANDMKGFGSLAKLILDQCGWEVEGVILDDAGEAVEDSTKRRAIARRACLLHGDRLMELVMGVLVYLGDIPGNWRAGLPTADLREALEPGTSFE